MPVCGIFVPVVQAHVMSMLDGLLHYSAHPDVSPPPPPWWKIEIPAHQNSILPTIETWVRSCVNNLMIDQSNTTLFSASLKNPNCLKVWGPICGLLEFITCWLKVGQLFILRAAQNFIQCLLSMSPFFQCTQWRLRYWQYLSSQKYRVVQNSFAHFGELKSM